MATFAIVAGLAVGLALGLLGGGGGVLAIPVLVYGLGQPIRQAVPTSLLVVSCAAGAGMMAHLRAGRVRWRTALGFGVAGVAGSVVGAWASGRHLWRWWEEFCRCQSLC